MYLKITKQIGRATRTNCKNPHTEEFYLSWNEAKEDFNKIGH